MRSQSKRSLILCLVMVVACLVTAPPGVLAHETSVSDFFPTAAELGDAWTDGGMADTDVAAWPSFSRMVAAQYFGPDGSRVALIVARVHDGPAATREAWTIATQMFERYRANMLADQPRADDPPLTGCSSTQRAQGTERVFTSIAAAVTLCASDPNTIVIAYVSGSVLDQTGSLASDHLVSLVLNTLPA